jgi:hypothetical protein
LSKYFCFTRGQKKVESSEVGFLPNLDLFEWDPSFLLIADANDKLRQNLFV